MATTLKKFVYCILLSVAWISLFNFIFLGLVSNSSVWGVLFFITSFICVFVRSSVVN